MADINLYKIDSERIDECIRNLASGKLERKNTIIKIKNFGNGDIELGATLYVEKPFQSEDEISWNWILREFKEELFNAFKAPKAVLLIEEENNELERNVYAVTFGSVYFKIDRFCDRDFGFKFASRMEYTNIKTTTLMSPNLLRNKTVNTYINYNELDFNSGESFSKLKVNVKLDDNFSLFKPLIEIGNSIHFNIKDKSLDTVLDLIGYVENILKIPDKDVKYRIPLFQLVKDEVLKEELNKKLDSILVETLTESSSEDVFSIPELEIVGTSEVFNNLDDIFKLSYGKKEVSNLTILNIDVIRKFCKDRGIDTIENINKIKVIRYKNDEPVVTVRLRDIIEYTDDDSKCVLFGGKWYLFNHDYLTYLNDSIREIEVFYDSKYDFNDEVHKRFINEMYEKEKDEHRYIGKTKAEIESSLERKYYVERCFNILREKDGKFQNFDRVGTSAGFEKMDLYEIDTRTMFAVKKGKASSDLCYAIDQSLTSLKKYKHGEVSDMPHIDNVGLWFILERKSHLRVNYKNMVDLCSLDMLMLKNRIDQWKKEVRLAGYRPVIYINYKN